MKQKHPTALVILDGWGFAPDSPGNAITQANPQTFNYLWNHYPHALLQASGPAVGLPEHVVGNSEVGHLTIGAGRRIEQSITRINNAIDDGSFFENKHLQIILKTCKQKNGRLHLLGLLSDGMVHSNIDHLYALIQAAHNAGIEHIYVHAFLDGRDVAPHSAEKYLAALEKVLQKYKGAELGSMSGRYFAMDRDENWDRTLQVFTLLTHQLVSSVNHTSDSEEFTQPALLNADACIHDNDTLIFFNIRPDRMRQLVSLFLRTPLASHKNTTPPQHVNVPHNLTIATMVKYYDNFKSAILFEKENIQNTLLDILEKHHTTMFTIAETEKYAHVTYFFSGGKETQRSNETRVLIPSPAVATYDLKPAMAAQEITQAVVASLQTNPCDFYLINYANADMVGHTGNFEKTKEAITVLDQQLKILYEIIVKEKRGTLYITADHGKAEQMQDATGSSKTAHATNPVPFIMVREKGIHTHELPLKELSDIAPFILKNIEFTPEL